MLGERRDSSRAAEMKMYVFRRDSRETEHYRLLSYNFYRHEGFRLIELGRYREAVRSLTNAIDYQSHDAHAYNDRGFCFLQLGEYERAIEDCSMAIALDGSDRLQQPRSGASRTVALSRRREHCGVTVAPDRRGSGHAARDLACDYFAAAAVATESNPMRPRPGSFTPDGAGRDPPQDRAR
jgi:tetratricopeptide (TPR) repeat protein